MERCGSGAGLLQQRRPSRESRAERRDRENVCGVFLSVSNGQLLDAAQLQALDRLASKVVLPAGKKIFLEAQPADSVFGLAKGFVRLYKRLPDGNRRVLGFSLPGDFLDVPISPWHSCSAETVGEALLCRFSRAQFVNIVQANPNSMRRLVELAAKELEWARELLLLLGSGSAEKKVMNFLISWRSRLVSTGTSSEFVPLPMQRKDIADLLGLTKETVSRTFTKLKAKNVLRIAPNGVIFKEAAEQLYKEIGLANHQTFAQAEYHPSDLGGRN